MKSRKRLWINLARVVVFAVLVFVLTRLIHFKDEYYVKSAKLVVPAGEVQADGDGFRVRGEWHKKEDVEFREGFFSLFRRLDRKLYFLIAPAFVLAFLACGYRWYLLLRASGFDVKPGPILLVTYIGGFFNTFLPGAVGGDIARAMIAAQGEERKAALVGSILLDRIIGLMSMILLATVCVVPFVTNPAMRQPVMLVGGLFVCMVVGYVVYFSPAVRRIAGGLRERGRVGRVLHDLDAAFQLLKHQKGVVAKSIVLSFVAQSITIASMFVLSRSLRMTAPSLGQFFVFDPIIFVITAVPVMPGGWGVQEGAFALLFDTVGVPKTQSVALSILYKLTLIFVTLPGGILFALGAARRRREGGTGPEVGGTAGDVPAHQ